MKTLELRTEREESELLIAIEEWIDSLKDYCLAEKDDEDGPVALQTMETLYKRLSGEEP